MSRGGGFDFKHLEEEDDTDIGEPHLQLELQPHLTTYNKNNYIGSPATDVVTADTNNTTDIEAFTNGSHKHSEPNNVSNSQPSSAQVQPKVHIQYSATDGKVNVLQGQVVTRPDGSRYINTRGIHQHWSELERPLRQKKIKLLKIFSILACIAFFPFGILAVYFAFRTERELNEGIMKGNIDRAQKFAKRAEKLIMISLLMCLVIVALVVALVVGAHRRDSLLRGPIMG
ncbi:unnamed protein product [Candidula unifasciata]|uniref:Uncharacterized protein n=1 Tax=Candidula unifasciata TaxID=100452 RepID=A0A8S3ZT99_9EUPU|nr:unnamed protein product [Candidula unifasciata]